MLGDVRAEVQVMARAASRPVLCGVQVEPEKVSPYPTLIAEAPPN